MDLVFLLVFIKTVVPGEPQDVRVNAINSTALHVQWKDPLEKDRNGIIMGYHIHVQETKEEVCRWQNAEHAQHSIDANNFVVLFSAGP